MGKKVVAAALVALSLGSTCQAAVSDAGTGEYYKKEKELYQGTAPEQENVVNRTPTEKEKPHQEAVRIFVRKIQTDPSEILTKEEIEAVTSKYEGKEATLQDLYTAVAAINTLYKEKSYITAKAILPPQKIEDGVVKIRLVEGHFGEFIPDGNRHTKSAYIQERIAEHSGDLVKLDQLQKDLFYFNNTNDVALRAELKPGKKTGTTDCILHVKEPEEWQGTLFADNAGRDESGLYRMGMVLTNSSLFGNREELVLNPTWTRGTMAGSVSYTIPTDNRGTRMGISYSKNQTDIISGPYESMDIAGHTNDVGFSLTHPFFVGTRRKVEGYAELHRKDSSTDFFGNTLLDTKVKTATVGSNIRTFDPHGGWFSQYSFTEISATKKDAYDDRDFWRFNLSLVRQQTLDLNRSLVWRLSGQMTDKSELPSSEQFSLGGMSSVKGFTEGLRSGDQGYYIGLEYDFPLHFSPQNKGLLFFDHGCTYNSFNDGTSGKDYLTSTGFGVILNPTSDVFGKIVVGFPLNASQKRDTARIHFYVQTNL